MQHNNNNNNNNNRAAIDTATRATTKRRAPISAPTHERISSSAPTTTSTTAAAERKEFDKVKTSEWVHALQVLRQRQMQCEAEVTAAMQHVLPSVQQEAQEDSLERVGLYRELLGAVCAARKNPKRFFIHAVNSVEEQQQELAKACAAFEHVTNEAQAILASYSRVEKSAAAMLEEMCFAKSFDATHRPPPGPTPQEQQQQQQHSGPLLQEAKQYDAFLQKHHSVTLGWTEDEHREFLRRYACDFFCPQPRQHPSTVSPSSAQNHQQREFVMALHQLPVLQHYTLDDIQKHVDLYHEFQRLHDAKKLALAAWREQKEADAMNERVLSELQSTRLKLQKQRCDAIADGMRAKDQQDKHESVRSWRIMKQERAALQAIEQQAALEAKKTLENRTRAARQAEIRNAVTSYRTLRQEQQQCSGNHRSNSEAPNAARSMLPTKEGKSPQEQEGGGGSARTTRTHSAAPTKLDLEKRRFDDRERTRQKMERIRHHDPSAQLKLRQGHIECALQKYRKRTGLDGEQNGNGNGNNGNKATTPRRAIDAPTVSVAMRQRGALTTLESGNNNNNNNNSGMGNNKKGDGSTSTNAALCRGVWYESPRAGIGHSRRAVASWCK